MTIEGLHITYRRSGGIAGIDVSTECTGADLTEDEAQVVADLLSSPEGARASGKRATAEPPTAPHIALGFDQFTHTVRIQRGSRARTFTWSDGTVPTSALPLLVTLRGLAKPQRAP